MAYNFKSIADVEVVAEPAESANVLIEEDGVIKKAPKTAVGGGDKWDAIIEVENQNYDNTLDSAESYAFKEGSYDSIKAAWDDGKLPKVLLEYVDSYGCNYYHRAPSDAVVYAADDTDASDNLNFYLHFNIAEFSNGGSSLKVQLSSDNTFVSARWE